MKSAGPPPLPDPEGPWAEIRREPAGWRPWVVTYGPARLLRATSGGFTHRPRFRTLQKAEAFASRYIERMEAQQRAAKRMEDGVIRLGSRAEPPRFSRDVRRPMR